MNLLALETLHTTLYDALPDAPATTTPDLIDTSAPTVEPSRPTAPQRYRSTGRMVRATGAREAALRFEGEFYRAVAMLG